MSETDIETVKACINNLSAHKFSLPAVDERINFLTNASALLIFYTNCNANCNANVNANSDVVNYNSLLKLHGWNNEKNSEKNLIDELSKDISNEILKIVNEF